MRTVVLASNFYRKRVLSEREWVKAGWMMSIDKKNYWAFSSFLPSFPTLLFFLVSYHSSFLPFILLHLFLFNHSLSLFLFSLYFKAHSICILTTLTSSLLFIVVICMWTTSKRAREKKKETELESFTLSS